MKRYGLVVGMIFASILIAACGSFSLARTGSPTVPADETVSQTAEETVTPESLATPVESPVPPEEGGTPAIGREARPGEVAWTITPAYDGQEINVFSGERLLLVLGEGYTWTHTVDDPAILTLLEGGGSTPRVQGAYTANQPGSTTLRASGDPLCRSEEPPCAMPARLISVHVVVLAAAISTQDSRTITSTELDAMSMFNAQDGWAISQIPDDQMEGGMQQRLLHTSNGGFHWQDVTPSGLDPSSASSAYFLDQAHAWLAVPDLSSTGSGLAPVVIYSTADAGKSWYAAKPVSDIGAPGKWSFSDAAHGWFMVGLGAAAGSEAVAIYQTQDGGQSWEQVSLTSGFPEQSTPGSLPFACNKSGIAFINETTGWATGSCPGGDPYFYVSHDGGHTWERTGLPAPTGDPAAPLSNCLCSLDPPAFVSDNDGFMPVMIYNETLEVYLYSTHDGGNSWQAHLLPVEQLAGEPLFIDAQNGWISDGKQLFHTQDGGQNWTAVGELPSGTEQVAGLKFINAQQGWFTNGRQVFITADGGLTWQAIIPVLER